VKAPPPASARPNKAGIGGADHKEGDTTTMKHTLTALAILFALTADAQNVTRDSQGNYIALPAIADSAKVTPYTYTDKAGKVWPVYATSEGKHYILKTSAKSGKQYRYYLKP